MYRAKTVDRMEENRAYSNAKAKRLLGFRPAYSLEQAITETVEYNLDNRHIKRHHVSPVGMALFWVVVLLIVRLFSYGRWKEQQFIHI